MPSSLSEQFAFPWVHIGQLASHGVTQHSIDPTFLRPTGYRGTYVAAGDGACLWHHVVAGACAAGELETYGYEPDTIYQPQTEDQIARAQLHGSTFLDVSTLRFGEYVE